MNYLKNFYGHLCTILHHKNLVRHYCFKAGLYKQGIMHDWSKYNPIEFFAGVKYYQGGKRSPNFAEKEDKKYSSAWLHHKGRNKHHMEYWIDYGMPSEPAMVGMRMPDNYVVEMFIDRMSASKNYQKEKYTDRSALEYYLRGKNRHIMHPEVRELLEKLLYMLADEGEDATFDYIRREVLHNKK